jgi:hypothetical protein
MAQQNLDLAYKDFLEQRGFPQQQLQTLLMGSQGLPSPVTQTTTQPGQGAIGTAGDIAGVLAGLKTLGIFK